MFSNTTETKPIPSSLRTSGTSAPALYSGVGINWMLIARSLMLYGCMAACKDNPAKTKANGCPPVLSV
jgi:hypothetical protein